MRESAREGEGAQLLSPGTLYTEGAYWTYDTRMIEMIRMMGEEEAERRAKLTGMTDMMILDDQR